MIALAKFSVRRPRIALAGWVVLAAVLSVIGLSVDQWVSPQVSASKTESYPAQQLADAKFGPTQNLLILLEGPRAQLDRQGPKLVAALIRRGNTRVLSAWDAGTASAGLRPKPTAAMIIASRWIFTEPDRPTGCAVSPTRGRGPGHSPRAAR